MIVVDDAIPRSRLYGFPFGSVTKKMGVSIKVESVFITKSLFFVSTLVFASIGNDDTLSEKMASV